MKKRTLRALLAVSLLLTFLSGCSDKTAEKDKTLENTEPVPAATIPADGDPDDVTCKGSYTGDVNAGTVIATMGETELTNGELQVWYWATVSQYRQAQNEISPDFDQPLDVQVCELDPSVASWQQYFLREALNAWHSAQAMVNQSKEEPLALEEAYNPNLDNYAKYLTDIPATKYLYGYEEYYQPNTMHQEYLDQIPATLEALAQEKGYSGISGMADAAFGTTEEILKSVAETYNYGYMYFTELSYDIAYTDEDVAAEMAEDQTSSTGTYVDIRHLLLIPEESGQETVAIAADGTVTCGEELWAACEQKAQGMLKDWLKTNKGTEATFADLANKNSMDQGSALNGGAYRQIRKGQLMDELDAWCFDSSRQPGDTTVIRSNYGIHILYFSGSTDVAYAEAEHAVKEKLESALIEAAWEAYPAEIDYNAITLCTAEASVSVGEILYPDIAHERFPEIPLYLQQDYPGIMYGGYELRTNGCGITSMSMVASYLADEEWTPPEMCALYGRYSHRNGTDGMIFNNESAVLGFYLREKTYDPRVAKAALEEGQIVVSIQHAGYWTSGGHYIVLESINEDGMIQVRDSNIFNYGKLKGHIEDLHTWSSITSAGSGYWIFEDKITNIPACSRCGDAEEAATEILKTDYICEKCQPAMIRRDVYLSF